MKKKPAAMWILSTMLLGAVACSTPPEPQPARWAKEGASEADLERARAACISRAAESNVASNRYRSVVQGGAFMRCMQDGGWQQVPDDS